ncbi:MAG: glycosyltransferase family 2 protein [Acidimicrobiia bacterium]
MSTGRPLVTIGIPVFNGAPRIASALESAVAQTYPNLAVVVSDNGSDDETPAICERIASNAGNVMFHAAAENRGATWNFNNVFLQSEGEYFKWMGHDDLLDPTTIDKAVTALEADPDLAIAHWLERIVNDEGSVLREYGPEQGFEVHGTNAATRFRQMLDWRRHGYAGDPIYGVIRRGALEKTRLLSNMHNPNYLLLEELAAVGGITTIPDLLSTRVYNDVRVTTKKLLTWLDPSSDRRYPHFERAREHFRIGLASSQGMVGERIRTLGVLIRYHMAPRELKGFAWDVRENLRR